VKRQLELFGTKVMPHYLDRAAEAAASAG